MALSTLVGAVLVARGIGAGELSDEILADVPVAVKARGRRRALRRFRFTEVWYA